MKRGVVSATEKTSLDATAIYLPIEQSHSRRTQHQDHPKVLKDVVKVVMGSTRADDHHHEDYWNPSSPGKVTIEPKLIKRKLRKAE